MLSFLTVKIMHLKKKKRFLELLIITHCEEECRDADNRCLTFQLGAKKGLGAQKVSSKNFSEVEKQAQVAEKLREEQAAEAKKQAEESM